MLLIMAMGMIIVVQHIKRFKRDRDYVVLQSIKDWIHENRIKVISVDSTDCGHNRITAEVRYEVEN